MLISKVPRTFPTRSIAEVIKDNAYMKSNLMADSTADLESRNEEGRANSPSILCVSKRASTLSFISHKRSLVQFVIPSQPSELSEPCNKKARCLLHQRSAEGSIANIKTVRENTRSPTPIKTRRSRMRRMSIPARQGGSSSASTTTCANSQFRQINTPQCEDKQQLFLTVTPSLVLQSYWIRKGAIDAKYKEMLDRLSIEESIEVSMKITKSQDRDIPKEVLLNIKNEYAKTRFLLLQQRLMEQEELINEYKKELSSVQ